MKHGFVKVAAIAFEVKVADPVTNAERLIEAIKDAAANGARVIVSQELGITGYTCQDLFLQDALLGAAEEALIRIADETKGVNALIYVGLPLEVDGKLYNVAAALNKGEILGFIPKRNLPNYGEFYEKRHFSSGRDLPKEFPKLRKSCSVTAWFRSA